MIRHALWITLESKAAAGDARAIRLLNGGVEAIKASLRTLGIVEPSRADIPPDPTPRAWVGRYPLPLGPCACCARGLLIYQADDAGRLTHVLVRHDLIRGLDVPTYPGKEHLAVRWGIVPTDDRHERGQLGGPVDPAWVLPEPTGPTRDELWALALQVQPRDPQARPERLDEPHFLPLDFPVGEDPPAAHRHLYELVSSLTGQGRVWKMRPEHRGVKHEDGGPPDAR